MNFKRAFSPSIGHILQSKVKQKSSMSGFYAEMEICKTSGIPDPIILNIKR
jgi:hypothetical protein